MALAERASGASTLSSVKCHCSFQADATIAIVQCMAWHMVKDEPEAKAHSVDPSNHEGKQDPLVFLDDMETRDKTCPLATPCKTARCSAMEESYGVVIFSRLGTCCQGKNAHPAPDEAECGKSTVYPLLSHLQLTAAVRDHKERISRAHSYQPHAHEDSEASLGVLVKVEDGGEAGKVCKEFFLSSYSQMAQAKVAEFFSRMESCSARKETDT